MSSFKKLRLDPELPPGHRNQSGANDSGGRSFLDGSSFSSSTSGGSGAYGRRSGPFRTRYSQPLSAASPSASSFSRFAPYYFGKERRTSLRVPLIRARRDDSDSEGNRPGSRASLNSSLGGESTASATSSTAQRIIETLQNLSTPVMNAGKIRIDQDIKAVQPLPFGGGSPLSRISPGGSFNRSSGPPKMCSSLLLSNPSPANQTSPMFNPGDQRRLFCIPRMIDAATNTDKEEASSPSQMHFSNKPTAVSITSPFAGASNLKPMACASSKEDNSEEEFHECSSEFTFSSPWTPDVFDRYLASGKEDKSTPKGSFGAHQPLMNGFREAPTSLGAQQLPSKSIASFAGFSGAGPSPPSNSAVKSSPTSVTSSGFSGFSGTSASGGFGSTPLKEVGLGKTSSTLSSEGKNESQKSFGSGSIGSISSSSEFNKAGSSPLIGFSFGKPGSSPLKTLEASKPLAFGSSLGANDVKTPVSSSVDKVDAPKSDSPISSLRSSFTSSGSGSSSTLPPLRSLTKSSTTKWSCPTCMVDNDVVTPACVCCGEKNPSSQTSATTAPKLVPTSEGKKKWRCPTCMVDNELEAASCVCCSEKNPNPVPASTPLPSLVATSKKWRCPTCMVDNDPKAANCVCCSEKNPAPVVDNKDSSNAAGTASTPAFKFGVASAVASSSVPTNNSSFVFGASSQSDSQKSPASGFKFGLPPATTTSTAPVQASSTPLISVASTQSTSVAGTPTFKFGTSTPTSSVSSVPTPAPSFGFNSQASTSSLSTNSVSTATTSSNSMFSAPPESKSSSSGGGIFGSANFQTPQSTPNNSFKFGGSTAAATNDAQKPSATPTFNFGAAASTKPAFNSSFSFGDRQQTPNTGLPGATSSILTPAAPTPTPAPTLGGATANFSFGSNNPTTSPFGQPPSNPSTATQPASLFQFGRGAPSNSQPSLTPAPTPSFSITPNLNFGATPSSTIPFGNPTQPTPNAGSQPPPALFQFNSTPSDSPGGRKIKKAVRRFNK